MFKQESDQLLKVIQDYFDGIFKGDTKKLKRIFHPDSILVGDVNNDVQIQTITEYLERVRNRKSPKTRGEKNRMNIVSLEVVNNIAYAKLDVPMFQFKYLDFITFSKMKNEWQIVNKVFTENKSF